MVDRKDFDIARVATAFERQPTMRLLAEIVVKSRTTKLALLRYVHKFLHKDLRLFEEGKLLSPRAVGVGSAADASGHVEADRQHVAQIGQIGPQIGQTRPTTGLS